MCSKQFLFCKINWQTIPHELFKIVRFDFWETYLSWNIPLRLEDSKQQKLQTKNLQQIQLSLLPCLLVFHCKFLLFGQMKIVKNLFMHNLKSSSLVGFFAILYNRRILTSPSEAKKRKIFVRKMLSLVSNKTPYIPFSLSKDFIICWSLTEMPLWWSLLKKEKKANQATEVPLFWHFLLKASANAFFCPVSEKMWQVICLEQFQWHKSYLHDNEPAYSTGRCW